VVCSEKRNAFAVQFGFIARRDLDMGIWACHINVYAGVPAGGSHLNPLERLFLVEVVNF
jgi:hypothetical protein